MKKLFYTVLVSTVLFVSCKKDPVEVPCNIDMGSIAGPYKLSVMKYKGASGGAETDITGTISPCEVDDIVTFKANGTVTNTDAGTVCSPAGNTTATWSLSGKNLSFDGEQYTIESFDCKTLVLSQLDFIMTGNKVTVFYTKQ